MSPPHLDRIVTDIREAEENLTRGIRRQERRWRYRVRRGRIRFDDEAGRVHKRFKQGVPAFLLDANVFSLLTAPIIYSLGLPMLILDLWVTMYQWTCFPVYGIARVSRRSYFFIDRHTLAYLNAIEKANCMYCSYATGLFAYVREVAARTELYWCPIKHARAVRAPHSHYRRFLDYGDAEGYRLHLPALRRTLDRSASCPQQAKGEGRGFVRVVRKVSSISRVERSLDFLGHSIRRGPDIAQAIGARSFPMWFVGFMRSVPGRLLRVALGVWLIGFGATHPSLLGLVLMMVGMVPAVTGFAGINLLEEVMKGRRARHLPSDRPSERRA